MVECYRQGKSPDSSTRALEKSYQQSYLVAKQKKVGEDMMNLALPSIFAHTSKGLLTSRKILRYGADGFTFPSKEGVLRIFIVLISIALDRE
jgi:hypothetical protein